MLLVRPFTYYYVAASKWQKLIWTWNLPPLSSSFLRSHLCSVANCIVKNPDYKANETAILIVRSHGSDFPSYDWDTTYEIDKLSFIELATLIPSRSGSNRSPDVRTLVLPSLLLYSQDFWQNTRLALVVRTPEFSDPSMLGQASLCSGTYLSSLEVPVWSLLVGGKISTITRQNWWFVQYPGMTGGSALT